MLLELDELLLEDELEEDELLEDELLEDEDELLDEDEPPAPGSAPQPDRIQPPASTPAIS